jgi:hypothetical protein
MPPSLTFADRFGCLIPDTLADSDDHSHSSNSDGSDYEPDDTSLDHDDDDFDYDDDDNDDDDPDDGYDDADAAGHPPIVPTDTTDCDPPLPDACPITGVDRSINNGDADAASIEPEHNNDDVSSDGAANDGAGATAESNDADESNNANDGAADEFNNDINSVDSNDDQIGNITGVDSIDDDVSANMDQRYGVQNHDINLRPQKERTYNFRYDHQQHITFDEPFGLLFMTEQMSLKQGLKHFGKKGAEAVIAELRQIDYRDVMNPKHTCELSREQKS